MTTSTVNSLTSTTTQSSSIVPANEQISETGFLQLISTQMQNQDPLDPADPTEFLSQIEGLSEVSSLQSMQSTLQSQAMTSGSSLIGQSVLVPVSSATLTSGGTVTGAVQAPSGATALTVSVADSSGDTVDTFDVSPASSGLTNFSWDGLTSSGASAPAGTYTISVNATVDGSTESVTPLISSQVTSLTVDSTTSALDVTTNNGTVPMSSVVSVL